MSFGNSATFKMSEWVRVPNWGGAYGEGCKSTSGRAYFRDGGVLHIPRDGAEPPDGAPPGKTMGPETGSDIIHPLVDRMKDACENFTFPCGR